MSRERDADARGERHAERRDGEQARAWLMARGWAIRREPRELIMFTDEHDEAGAIMRRIWHTPVDLTRAAAPPSHSMRVLLQVSDSIRIDLTDGAHVVLDEGSLLVCADDAVSAMSSSAPSARIEVLLPRELSASPVGGRMLLHVRHGVQESTPWIALCALVNAVLNSPTRPTMLSRTYLRHSLVDLVSALIVDTTSMRSTTTRSPRTSESLFADAMTLLQRRAREPRFTIEALAAELGVSPRHLSRVFQSNGLSPRRALREQRSLIARALLAGSPALTHDDIAQQAGFGSARAMRHALENSPPDVTNAQAS